MVQSPAEPSLTQAPAADLCLLPGSGPSAEVRPCGQSLNPLAPPFTMRSSPAGPRSGPVSTSNPNFLPASTVTSPGSGPGLGPGSIPYSTDPKQVRLTLPYTRVSAAGEMGSASGDQQQHFLTMPFSMVSADSVVGTQGEERRPCLLYTSDAADD